MSLDLVDLPKIKVSIECHAWLKAHAGVSDKEINAVVRDVLHAWALEQARISKLADADMRARGLAGITGDRGG